MDPFEKLFEDNFRPIYQYVYYMIGNKADAEDITQEVFMKVASSYDKFRGESSVSTWIYTIARRTVVDFIRQKKTKKFLTFWKNHIPEDFEAADDFDLPSEIFEKKEQKEKIYFMLSRLPEKMRSVIYLRFMKGMSVQETALLLDISPNQVSVTQNRALAKLRTIMDTDTWVKEEIR
ncbi:RNA polymerase sigma factor [Ammoniphilus resinae]|uniref:RNA polymerase sigma-70 factor (ECF subfamily) n=1 Tax=Ammoniphilus resinae TaxID=861532 RepID=A0ABS4GSB0_9BACL|nr:sigma-70 family RNA polymerase sigma factor [Ammoniphilus resinae]MBP1933167.1 RNA polymerase sigma-70 factor (ECF subfamily) [Ammoniphilus resinae]